MSLAIESNPYQLKGEDATDVQTMIEQRAAKTPDAVAVVFEEASLTYAELNRRANRLARYLRTSGVGPDVRVGVCAERSLEMIVGVLGILKAGGAYLPLDPAYPTPRLQYMVTASDPALLLTQAHLQPLFCGITHCPFIVNLSDACGEASDVMSGDSERVETHLHPENLAYVIYTSGSTGLPKGVMVTHRGLRNLADAQIREFSVEPASRILQCASLSFDAFAWELVMALCQGATLCLPGPQEIVAGENLANIMARHQITHATVTPAALLDVPEQELESVTTLIVAGDRLTSKLANRWTSPERTLIDAYGPTEATVCATMHHCQFEEHANPPIGRPIMNARVYVLGHDAMVALVGDAGELCIGGEGVARGYLNRPDLTAERFVPDPFTADPGGRIYRTGDLGRLLPDGNLDFLGRNDHQVKIRGYRIELEEIESRLVEHPAVREAIVIAKEDVHGDRRLVAYLVIEPNSEGKSRAEHAQPPGILNDLREWVKEQLPGYMVPAAYVALDSLPLTPNGKLDRAALPACESYAVRDYEAPLGETERALADLWAWLLQAERVGRRDNFFELGGHSLAAVRLVTHMRQALALDAKITDVFRYPVLSDFAAKAKQVCKPSLPPMAPIERVKPLQLSFAQQRLWFLAQAAGASQAYHISFGLRLRGKLDRSALRRSLNTIVGRHEVLRTNFALVEGQPAQWVRTVEDRFFELLEAQLTPSCEGAELEQHAIGEAENHFDFEHGPLIRGRLLQLADDEHALLVTVHHIVFDAWSMGIFTRELNALYGAFLRGEPDPLPPLPVQYADYAAWERRWAEAQSFHEQAAYWKENLSSVPPLLEIPADYARPAHADYAGGLAPLALDQNLCAALKQLSRRQNATLYMILLASWAIVLARLSGQEEVVVGTPVANRGRAEAEELIGFFVNVLPLRLDVGLALTLRDLLMHVRAQALGAQQHQDIPFDKIVEIVRPDRSLAHAPLFQSVFAWQNTPEQVLSLPDIEITPLEPAYRSAKFDLTLLLRQDGPRIVGGVEYATALFRPETSERYVGYLLNVLRGMVADEEQRVGCISMMSDRERKQILHAWNDTERMFPREKSLGELFEEQVAEKADAVAVTDGRHQVTFRELNRRANQLAHYMRKLGVKPEVRVGVCLARNVDMAVGLLAIVKAGGAYVPLDPGYPQERLLWMLNDSAVGVLLTEGQQQGLFSGIKTGVPVLELKDGSGCAWQEELESNPVGNEAGLKAEHLAYVIYTSGSTGKPKGVMVTHRNVVRLVRNTNYVELGSAEVIAQASNASFDAATFEIWGALLNGSRLVIVDQQVLLEARRFGEELEREGVTVLWLTVGMFNQYVDALSREFAKLRYLLVGGDALNPEVMARSLRWEPHPHLINGYGPTETTTFSTTHAIEEVEEGRSIPIGRPIANGRVYILDEQREVAPEGVVGELYIGGEGVGRGYQNQEEMTGERFVADEWSGEAGARMYRTGDLGRWLRSGVIEFVGRNDTQVKIRGFRIELGEIEARLTELAGVREAVVVARRDSGGEKRLVAYYTIEEREEDEGGGGGGAETAKEAEWLRRSLLGKLPEYMVPAVYVRMERMPLTGNGKVDRRALPEPKAGAYRQKEYEEPEGKIEKELAAMWTELLGVERVGRQDNFFDLGGHSLLALQLINRMQLAFDVDVQLKDIFVAKTIKAMATIATSLMSVHGFLSEDAGSQLEERYL